MEHSVEGSSLAECQEIADQPIDDDLLKLVEDFKQSVSGCFNQIRFDDSTRATDVEEVKTGADVSVQRLTECAQKLEVDLNKKLLMFSVCCPEESLKEELFSMFYNSTHKNSWLFEDQEKLSSLRLDAREEFLEKLEPEERHRCLNATEERQLGQLVEETAQKFCQSFSPQMPPSVAYIGFTYFKRIYLNNCIMEYSAKNVMMAALYLACKVDEFNVSIDDFVSNLRTGTKDGNTEVILGLEVQVMRLLRFHLTVHQPYRAFEGHLIDIKTNWPKIAKPELLRKKAEDFLWKSLLTDVPLLFPPSQISLASLLYAAKELGHDLLPYIEGILCGNNLATSEKLTIRLNDCISMVESVELLSTDQSKKLQEKVKLCMHLITQKQTKRKSESGNETNKRVKCDFDSDSDFA